jgi:hypothetical protein
VRGEEESGQRKETKKGENEPVKLVTRSTLVHRRDRLLQRTLSKARLRELVAPQQVRVRKVNGKLLFGREESGVLVVFEGTEDAVLRAYEIEGELYIPPPILRVVENEDGGEGNGGKVDALLSIERMDGFGTKQRRERNRGSSGTTR